MRPLVGEEDLIRHLILEVSQEMAEQWPEGDNREQANNAPLDMNKRIINKSSVSALYTRLEWQI